jgi:MFS family permease
MVLVFKLEGKRENLFYIFYGVFLVGLSFALLNILPLSLMSAFICMVLATLGEILAMPFINSFWIARTTKANRGEYAGLFTIAWSVAQALGPMAGSETAEYFNFRILWWGTGGICLLSAIGFRWLRQNKAVAIN